MAERLPEPAIRERGAPSPLVRSTVAEPSVPPATVKVTLSPAPSVSIGLSCAPASRTLVSSPRLIAAQPPLSAAAPVPVVVNKRTAAVAAADRGNDRTRFRRRGTQDCIGTILPCFERAQAPGS